MVIADAGLWLALANRRDRHHERAKRALAALDETLITTWPVLTEACHQLMSRLGADAMRRFLQALEGGAFTLFELGPQHTPSILELSKRYGDLPMDLADASLVILAEHLGRGRILSTDQRDFQTYRWKQREPFENLLIDGSA